MSCQETGYWGPDRISASIPRTAGAILVNSEVNRGGSTDL
jgi:hypothetical protein